MAAIALTIIILLNYLAFYYAYGAFEGSVGTKKRRFFSRQKSRRCAPGGGVGANLPLNFPPKKTLTKKKGQICPLAKKIIPLQFPNRLIFSLQGVVITRMRQVITPAFFVVPEATQGYVNLTVFSSRGHDIVPTITITT